MASKRRVRCSTRRREISVLSPPQTSALSGWLDGLIMESHYAPLTLNVDAPHGTFRIRLESILALIEILEISSARAAHKTNKRHGESRIEFLAHVNRARDDDERRN